VLGANLAFAREAAGITQADLAAKARTSRATIALIESGGGDPRLSTLVAIAEALSVSVYVLLLGKSEVNKLVELVDRVGDLADARRKDKDHELLQELSSSQLMAERRRAARMSTDLATNLGFVGKGVAVGAAIGTMILPGLGTAIGAFLCGAVLAKNKR